MKKKKKEKFQISTPHGTLCKRWFQEIVLSFLGRKVVVDKEFDT